MFAVIYRFEVKENRESDFIIAWEELTQLIYEYAGSLGSRLHEESEGIFLAYAQWPNRKLWKNAGDKLPEEAKAVSSKMKAACRKIETLHELELTKDLLRSNK